LPAGDDRGAPCLKCGDAIGQCGGLALRVGQHLVRFRQVGISSSEVGSGTGDLSVVHDDDILIGWFKVLQNGGDALPDAVGDLLCGCVDPLGDLGLGPFACDNISVCPFGKLAIDGRKLVAGLLGRRSGQQLIAQPGLQAGAATVQRSWCIGCGAHEGANLLSRDFTVASVRAVTHAAVEVLTEALPIASV